MRYVGRSRPGASQPWWNRNTARGTASEQLSRWFGVNRSHRSETVSASLPVGPLFGGRSVLSTGRHYRSRRTLVCHIDAQILTGQWSTPSSCLNGAGSGAHTPDSWPFASRRERPSTHRYDRERSSMEPSDKTKHPCALEQNAWFLAAEEHEARERIPDKRDP